MEGITQNGSLKVQNKCKPGLVMKVQNTRWETTVTRKYFGFVIHRCCFYNFFTSEVVQKNKTARPIFLIVIC